MRVITCWNSVSRKLPPVWRGLRGGRGLARFWLTPWAVERRPVHELLPSHHRAAAPARLALASVGVQRSLEVPGFAVDIDIERVERRAALAQRVGHHLRRRIQQLAEPLAAQRRRQPGSVDLDAPQCLVGIDVPDARHHGLIQQLPLDLGMLAPQHVNDAIAVEPGIQRIAGDVRDGRWNVGAVDRDHVGQHPPAERALVDEAQRGAVVEQRRDAQVALVLDGAQQHLPAHPEMDDQSRVIAQGEPQILAAAAGAGDAHVQQPRRQIGRSRLVTAHGAGMVHPHGGDGLARHVCLEPPPYDFDLGKFRHRRCWPTAPSTPRPRPSTRLPSWSGRRPCRTRCPSRRRSR